MKRDLVTPAAEKCHSGPHCSALLAEVKNVDAKIRSRLSAGRIARVFFCVHEGHMALLHGFIKKSQKTPDKELAIAEKRMKGLSS